MAKKIMWLGHAGFILTSPEGKVIVIDPWIVENPLCPVKLEEITKADIVLVSHDHFDHLGNAMEIARRTGAMMVCQVELAGKLKTEGFPAEKIPFLGFGMNIGAYVDIEGIRIIMTQALHSASVGTPCGYIIRLEDGSYIYHTGDTGIFETMRLIGELYPLDLLLVPIGGCFTMDPFQASKAVSLLRPKKAIPMHYKTFPILEQSPDAFISLVKKEAPEVEIIVLEPGKEYIW